LANQVDAIRVSGIEGRRFRLCGDRAWVALVQGVRHHRGGARHLANAAYAGMVRRQAALAEEEVGGPLTNHSVAQ
jgi:hypothetical protein